MLSKEIAHLGNDAHLIGSNYGNNCIHTKMIMKKAPFGKGQLATKN